MEALREAPAAYRGDFREFRAARRRHLGAKRALAELEPEAVRAAEPLLSDENADNRVFAVWLFGEKLGAAALPELVYAFDDSSGSVVQAALTAVGELGEAGHEALPELERMLFEHELAETAAKSIARIGLRGLPILVRGLQAPGQTEKVRWASAHAFSEGNAEFRAAAVPELLKLLERDDVRLQTVVARALGECGKEARPAAPVLRKHLQRENCGFELSAIEALRSIGIDSDETIEVLKTKCNSDYAPTRGSALRALAEVAADYEDLLPLFLRGLESTDWLEQAAGAQGAGAIGPKAASAVPRITELLQAIVSGKEERRINNTDRLAVYLEALAKITWTDIEKLRARYIQAE